MIVDVVFLLLLASGFVLGFFRGVLRQLLALGGCLFAFVAAVYLRLPIGDWLYRASAELPLQHAQMLAFAAVFLLIFGGAVALFELGRAGLSLSRHPLLDDALGGLAGLLLAAITAAVLVVILDSYYVAHPASQPGEVSWLRTVHDSLAQSVLATPLRDLVIRPLGFILEPVMPPELVAVMS